MKIIEEALGGVKLIQLDRFKDERGWFSELWNEERYRNGGFDVSFAQTNISSSAHGVLRGLHYQSPSEQGKLVTALAGAVFDVVVDVRHDSPDFGRWFGCELTEANARQLWVPEGFAHGFLVTGTHAVVHYSCTTTYLPEADRALAWNDPDVGIRWPFEPRTISVKDAAARPLRAIPVADLPLRGSR